MKKIFIYGAAALAGIFSLTNCTKEAAIETPAAGVPFEIYAGSAEVGTKTTIDGFSTSWAAKDSINLFHAISGTTTYQNDGKFTVADPASGRFTGTLSAALEAGENYDWYALYPYKVQTNSPANTSGWSYIGSRTDKSQTQAGANSTAHLAGYYYPLYGKSSAPISGSEAPSITLKPAFSVVEIEVKNSTANDLPVSSISFTAPESIVGQFIIDFSGENATYSNADHVSSTASLNVTGNATIAANASAKFYLAVKPFTAASGSTLKISVNGYEKSLKLTSDATFTAGKIKTLNFNYNKAESSTNETWTLVAPSSTMTDGVYVILVKHEKASAYGYLPNTKTNATPAYTSQTYFDGTTTSYTIKGVSDTMRWSFSKNSDGTWTIKNAAGNYLYGINDNKGAKVGTSTGKWTIAAHPKNSNAFSFKSDKNRYLGVYDNKDWRTYTSPTASNYGTNGQNSQIVIYKLSE